MGIFNKEASYSKSVRESESPDLMVTVDDWVPFTVDEDTCVETEVKSVIKHYYSIEIRLFLNLVLSGVYLVCVIIFMGFLIHFSDTFYLKTSKTPVPDRIHELVDRFQHPFSKQLCDILMQLFFSVAVCRLAFFSPHLYAYHVAMRIVMFLGTGNLIKAFFIFVTTMPDCRYNCDPKISFITPKTFLLRVFRGYAGVVDNCSDLIISGHSMYTLYSCILLCENTKSVTLRVIFILYTIFVLFVIVACKYHYTVDVLFGLLIAGLIHYFYYSKLDDYGVYLYNKIYHSRSKTFQSHKTTRAHNSLLTKLLANMELLEERLVLGQKMRTLYLLVNSKKNIIDPKLLRKFNICVKLFGADESGDILSLYRGTKKVHLHYWKSVCSLLFKKKKSLSS